MPNKERNNIDLTAFQEFKTETDDLISDQGDKTTMFENMEKMYLLDWPEKEKVQGLNEHIKLTVHPGPRNSILGAIRLMTATEPTFTVPTELDTPEVRDVADKLEKMATIIWRKAGRIQGDPVHMEIIRSAFIYGETHVGIIDTRDLVEQAKGASKGAEARAERIASITPFLFPVYSPKYCYADWDSTGLRLWHNRSEMTAGEIEDMFGDDARAVLNQESREYTRSYPYTLCQGFNLKDKYVWIDGLAEPIIQEEHGLSEIPIAAHRIEGSSLFDKEQWRTNPWLYGYFQSGMWNRQNMWLTAFFTILYGIGFNPIIVEYEGKAGQRSSVDQNTPGGRWIVPPGNRIEVITNKGIMDPAIREGWDLAENIERDSTMQRQALGEPLGKNTSFSYVSLMAQAGRLPLATAQRKGGWVIGDIVRMALTLFNDKAQGWKSKAFGTDMAIKIKDIPKYFEIEANLEVILPQERLQMASLINELTGGENPATSMRYVREKLLSIGNSDEMEEEIWGERSAKFHFEDYMMTMMEAAKTRIQQMKAAQAQLQQMQAGPPPGAMPPPEMPPQGPPPMPPEMPVPEGPPPGPAPVPGMPSPQIPQAMMEGGVTPEGALPPEVIPPEVPIA